MQTFVTSSVYKTKRKNYSATFQGYIEIRNNEGNKEAANPESRNRSSCADYHI